MNKISFALVVVVCLCRTL